MKWIANLIVLLVLLFPLVLAALIALSIDDKPLLQHRAELTPERIEQGKRIVDRYDPRNLRPGAITQVNLAQQDLDLAINYAANRTINAIAGFAVEDGKASLEATLKLPDTPLGNYLNLIVELRQSESLPRIDHAKLGKVWIPGFLLEWLLNKTSQSAATDPAQLRLTSTLKKVEFKPGRMLVTYQWREDMPAKLSGALWSPLEQRRLETYQAHLADLVKAGEKPLDLAALMQPLFRLACERSRENDAVAENRALALVLAFYVNQKDLSQLIPAAHGWPKPRWRGVRLNGRNDFTKHYLVSAMLAAYAGTPLADAVGLYKEIADSRGGSGFSFNDIAADRAGLRMGELAVADTESAHRIQQLLAIANQGDFMPETVDLPEYMPEKEFNSRFGGLQGEKYRQMMAEIDRRIAALTINRQ